ncbi:MAG: hypothetical protein ABJB03_01475 [Rhodoglobus sp.]
MTDSGATRTIDYSALTAPVSREEAKMFRAQARMQPAYASTSNVGAVIVVAVVASFFLFAFIGIASSFAQLITDLAQRGGGAGLIPAIVIPLIIGAALVLTGIGVFRSVTGGSGRWANWLRMTRFAAANGLVFAPHDTDPAYPGAIFGQGRSRTVLNHFRSADGRFFDFGSYRYVTGSGKSQTTHNWGFLALSLDRALPNMVLDSKANNGVFGGTNLPASFDKSQVLSLEGDFDKYFTLYCPKEYERDALYVFTPDLMALLIDEASPFDVEIVDKWMFVYSAAAFPPVEPTVYQRLFRIIDTVGAKTITQTDRYVDERVANFAANIVAPQGQRLKRGFSIGGLVIVVLVAVYWIGSFVYPLFSR